jgi:hypothetical protein
MPWVRGGRYARGIGRDQGFRGLPLRRRAGVLMIKFKIGRGGAPYKRAGPVHLYGRAQI